MNLNLINKPNIWFQSDPGLPLTPTHACFSGYFAPEFLGITDPIIGVGVAVLLVSTTLSFMRNRGVMTILIPIIFLLVSYFGHFNYSGDCGSEIVLMNKVAMFLAILWFLFEFGMHYVGRNNKKT